ncbi:nucleoside kinase [Dysgonomonas sp. Marseille-P4677]|uniref:nucleoside kinase n=1 Tax=Dysgonomonas sp. Marseille-P4677 TaxID=2364790 RepID=UPI0019131307|nr:nucleoside kinase [Dysgonomonas sp. Marseille-P4677]MBK5720446.1 nucleoside kinase [Dysgonomonas sp. Marseille-P4677]
MVNKVTVHCTNTSTYKDLPVGTNLIDVLKEFSPNTKYKVLTARVNNKTEPLDYQIYHNKTVTFVDMSEPSGMRTYVRSLCFLLAKAVSEVFPEGQLYIEHPISLGYFCRIINVSTVIDENAIAAIKAKIQEYIDADMKFEGVEEETEQVVKMFRERGFDDKALLLETTGEMYSKYYRLGDSVDYFYGCLAPSTGYISLYDLQLYHDGLLLRIPNRSNPVVLEPMIEQPKMYNVYQEHLEFLNIIGLDNVGDMNKANKEGLMPGVIKVSEAYQEKTIANIAEEIATRSKDGVRVVLISGPSSSGKTTFRMRLEVQLMVNLMKPVGLSLDNYFVDRDHTPLDENGGYDFESLYALDITKFNEDLENLLKGEEVSLPTFNFTTGQREYKGDKLKLDDHSILVIEGIHGLNPDLTIGIPDNQKYRVYVSALTTISLDNHNWIPTTDNRLLRRLIRDYRYRNYSAIDTLSRWQSVRKGEDKWIFPYQENADVMFNSAMMYEFAALRRYAEPILSQVPNNAPEYAEAHRLLKFLKYFNYINDRELPPTSLLREFVGGSSFKY